LNGVSGSFEHAECEEIEHCIGVIQAIPADLLLPHPTVETESPIWTAESASLAGGRAGMALFYNYLEKGLPVFPLYI
jgi:hypothetical protein